MNENETIIAGVDPGLVSTGVVVLSQKNNAIELVFFGTKKTNSKDAMPERLNAIGSWFKEIVDAHRLSRVAVEEVFAHSKHPGTAIAMAQARGVILAVCGAAGIEVQEIAPRKVKLAISGTGRASKRQIRRVIKRYLKNPDLPEDEHITDATALALCVAFETGKRPNLD